MMPESPNVLLCFQPHRIEERIINRVLECGSSADLPRLEKRGANLTTCEHEILPYEDAKFIANVVEHIWFIDASAPDTNHVLVPGNQKLEPFHILVISEPTVMVRPWAG